MEVKSQKIESNAFRFSIEQDGKEIGRAFLYIIRNDLHEEPYGLMEDVFVEEEYRRKGLGTELLTKLIEEAKKQGCYKLIGTSRLSRENIHTWYEKMGFKHWGKEFRIDF